jgi:hypothetical protein
MSKDKPNDNKPTLERHEVPEISPRFREFLDKHKSKEMPPSGTVRVTIFPNPREKKLIEDDKDEN